LNLFEPLPLDSVLTFIPETGIDREILSSFTVSSENVQYSVSLINPKGTMMEVATPVISLRSAGISLTSSLLESIPNQRAFISDGGSQVVNDAAVANYFEITTNVLLDGRQLTIDLTYDPTLFDFPEAQLQIARFDAQSGRWHRIVTTMDTVANTASFTTNKTSLFVLADSTDAVLSAAPSFPMPVELATLDAGQGQDGNIQLEWSTASESNNFGFYIERSIDGITWQEIGFVEGHGTTEVAHQYTFGDADAIAHTQYQYRLRQVDYNGAVTLSQEVSVMTSLPTQFALEQNYPNPFNPATHIRFTLAHVGHVALRVYDVTGRLVQTLVNESRQAGEFHETWDGKTSVGLAAATGVYFYRLETVSQVATRTMLLVR